MIEMMFYQDQAVQLLQGDALTVLKTLPDEYVQTVVTSPPYWGLRDYKVDGQVFGGALDCQHRWGKEVVKNATNHTGKERWQHTRNGRDEEQPIEKRVSWLRTKVPQGQYCQCCGAWAGSLGLEPTPELYVQHIVEVFREVRRVLKKDGTLWLNVGDSYAGSGQGIMGDGSMVGGEKQRTNAGTMNGKFEKRKVNGRLKSKDLVGIPWRVAFALQADGWYLRSDIIWAKPNPMPESVQGSHYSRHRVTIDDYERLSGLRYIDECAGNDWAGDMPSLSERETVSSKAPLSAERQGHSNGTRTRGTRGRKGKATTIQSLTIRETKQEKVRGHGEGSDHAQEGVAEVSPQSSSEGGESQAPSINQGQSSAAVTASSGESQVSKNREWQGVITASTCATKGRDPINGIATDSRGLAPNTQDAQVQVLLLQEENETDDGSRYPLKQEGATYENQCGSSVQSVQFSETRQDNSPLLVGCPGCDKCLQHHGYLFHLSAGRCTKSHEYVFLLTKAASYYFDQEAVREAHVRLWDESNGGNLSALGVHKANGAMRERGGAYPLPNPAGRNKRTVWTVATQPYSEAHFATFPEKLVEPCILAGCPDGGTVLDLFSGAATTLLVAKKLNRKAIGIELSTAYCTMSATRLQLEPARML